ncbi:hypothetical protein L1987_01933 [Smallanthus sonchifolius]|uniref:Uncharacterized protein n=1 Tax=Smallanthus sonchifolius TaxID=185202 RepID=A0ACB9K6L4_9ASTR|nr:hypothetical protein L1987_01933 [Smallanthus sonchifolius]
MVGFSVYSKVRICASGRSTPESFIKRRVSSQSPASGVTKAEGLGYRVDWPVSYCRNTRISPGALNDAFK